MVVNVSNVTDSSFVNVAHHLVGPDADRKAANIDRISSTHFWQVAAIQHGALTMDGRVEYNGLDSNSIDKDILFTSEDSLLLVYRKDKSEEWKDYPDYTKLIVNPSDRKGFVRISKLIPGDYALAHGYKATVGTKDIEKYHVQLYPNPVKDILNIPTQEFNTNFKFEIIDIRGQKVNSGTGESSIDLSQLAPGHYELLIKNQQSPNWKQARFVKQ
ncbi:MAG: T9SS type A sorting domain-containing protein [Saprospiraceae bacterium]|nr:T9SS type A sorting domain-containing protein [Saprospiraceae bacterium]